MSRAPRVLFLSGWPIGPYGEGAASFVYEQIELLANHVRAVYVEHRFDNAFAWSRRRLMHSDVEAIDDLWPENVAAWRVWTPRWSPRLTRHELLEDVWNAGAMIAARTAGVLGGVDIVHAHVVLPAGFLGAAVAEKLGVPLILQEHSSPFSMHLDTATKRAAVNKTLRLASAVCAVGDDLANRIGEQGPDASRIRLTPNLIRTSIFEPQTIAIDRARLRLISIGSLEARKGFDVLLDAIEILQDSGQQVDVRIVGTGTLRETLARRLTELGHDPTFALPGSLTRQSTAGALAWAHIYVCASRLETFGLAPAEALAVGRPVVSTRCGGPESFVDDTCGALVDRDDPRAMAEAIQRTWRRIASFDARQLHERIDSRFGPEAFLRRMMGVYDDVLRGRVAA